MVCEFVTYFGLSFSILRAPNQGRPRMRIISWQVCSSIICVLPLQLVISPIQRRGWQFEGRCMKAKVAYSQGEKQNVSSK